MGKIVYHGTLSEKAPHEHGYPFHAGTYEAAHQRLENEISDGVDWGEAGVGLSQIHAYEIDENAPTSSKTWQDPMFPDKEGWYSDPNDPKIASREVPEHSQSRIYPYVNSIEDKGSTSYVIPSRFVYEGQHVKHLGVQFQDIVAPSENQKAIYKAMSTMVGGK